MSRKVTSSGSGGRTLRIGGDSGDGIQVLGHIFAQACSQATRSQL